MKKLIAMSLLTVAATFAAPQATPAPADAGTKPAKTAKTKKAKKSKKSADTTSTTATPTK